MRIEKLWEGKLPSYWDVTAWASLAEDNLVVCYRDPSTRKRMLGFHDLMRNESSFEESVFNTILGNDGANVFLALIMDARSHLQVTRVTCYDVHARKVIWVSDQSFLVEKFKIPQLTAPNIHRFPLGNKQIDLYTGEVTGSHVDSQHGWRIGKHLWLVQKGRALLCVNEESAVLWERSDLHGSWFQGITNEIIYFLLPERKLLLLRVSDGQPCQSVDLTDLKVISKRAYGAFSYRNEASLHTSTVADVLVGDDFVSWVTDNNELLVKNMSTGHVTRQELGDELDYCLSAINGKNLLLYGIQSAEYGSLHIVKLEEI